MRMNPMFSWQSARCARSGSWRRYRMTAKSLPRCSAYMSVTVENFAAAFDTLASTTRGDPSRRRRIRMPGPTEWSSAVSPMCSATSGSSSTTIAASRSAIFSS